MNLKIGLIRTLVSAALPKASRLILLLSAHFTFAIGMGQVSVTTYHNDNLRTGHNSRETTLTPNNVNSKSFGLLNRFPVDGQVFAQPLVAQVNAKGSYKAGTSWVYVATEHNSVYAFQGNRSPSLVWHVNLGPSVPSKDFGTDDVLDEMGITGTPVISVPLATLFVVALTKENDLNGQPTYVNRLHALDLQTGRERPGSPVVIKGSVQGTGDGADSQGYVEFQSFLQFNRVGLLSLNSAPDGTTKETIYIGFGAHADHGPYHGWVFGYDAATLKRVGIFNTTPNGKTDPTGYPIGGGGVWAGGAAPASDGSGIFFMTGNGTFDASRDCYGDTLLKLTPRAGFRVTDYFTPSNQDTLNRLDVDLGSGGVILLPPDAGADAGVRLAAGVGKEGTIYLLNADDLGKYNVVDKVQSELAQAVGSYRGTPAYFNKCLFFGGMNGGIRAFKIEKGKFKGSEPVYSSTNTYRYPGALPVISSDGDLNGIVWSINSSQYGYGPSILIAHNAAILGDPIYTNDSTEGRDIGGNAIKFSVPTVANGYVYVGTANSVDIYGLGSWTEKPVLSVASGRYTDSILVSIACPRPGATLYFTTDGTTPTEASTKYTGPIVLSKSSTLMARAYSFGALPSAVTVGANLINAPIGTGSGLTSYYVANSQDPTSLNYTFKRTDPVVDFTWGSASPAPGVPSSNWAARWVGRIQAPSTGIYKFTTYSHDGVKITINGQPVISNYTYHATTADQGQMLMQAGEKYEIEILYFQSKRSAQLRMLWSGPGVPLQVVPRRHLYPE